MKDDKTGTHISIDYLIITIDGFQSIAADVFDTQQDIDCSVRFISDSHFYPRVLGKVFDLQDFCLAFFLLSV